MQKAKDTNNEWAKTAARRELRDAMHQRTHAKMIMSEQARSHDVAAIQRSLRGQGTPLLTNKHALGDDRGLQEI